MQQDWKGIGKGFAKAVLAWIIGCVLLMWTIGWLWGFLLATLLVGGGFLLWLLIDHPDVGEAAVDILFDTDTAGSLERAEEQDQQRNAQAYLDRFRRGNPRDST